MDADPVDLVRSGYNSIPRAYRGDDDPAREYVPWLAGLLERIPGRGQVLDVGCGCGLPVARRLAAAGHQVTGVDISDVQVERARRLVPGAVFLRGDATDLDFPPGSFDAVVCLYALIHMPLDRQPLLLRDIARWLRPGGWLLAVTGQDAWTGRGELARRDCPHVVEPGRRRHLSGMAHRGRPGGHQPAVRAGGRRRPRTVLGTGPPANSPQACKRAPRATSFEGRPVGMLVVSIKDD
jgi:SAM-dependent methyltransferase